jgi:hypothetical protein
MSEIAEISEGERALIQPKRLTSADLKIGLRHNKGDGYQVFFEVGNDTGTRVTRHADAVSIGIWPSTGHTIHGYEIKVSRGDFLAEMKDPAKAMPVMQYCHRWSLLTPPGLVKVDELPPNWGLSTYDGKTMRQVKAAPMLQPVPVSPGFVAALVRRAGAEDAGLIAAAVRKRELELKAEHAKALALRAPLTHDDRQMMKAGKDAIALVKAFKERLGVDWMNISILDELAPLHAAISKSGVSAVWGGLRNLVADMEKMAASLKAQMPDAGLDARKRR